VRLTVAISFAEHVAAARSTTSGEDDTLTSCARKQKRNGKIDWANILATTNWKEET
jgi:hypothetical protein